MPSVDDIADRIEDRIASVSDRIALRARTLLDAAELPDGTLSPEMMQDIANQLDSDIGRLGVDDVMGDLDEAMREIQDDILDEIKRSLPGAGSIFGRATRRVVDALMGTTLNEIATTFGAAADDIRRSVTSAVIGGVRRADLVENITKALSINMSQARTLVDTTLHGFHSAVLTSHGKESGIVEWGYRNPIDDNTREWCRHWAGRRDTVANIEATWDKWGRLSDAKGIEQPVMLWRGGWRCRGRWVPIVSERGRKDFKKGPRP